MARAEDSNFATPPSAMLLGENATGKSTVLQAVALALMSKEERGRLRLTPSDVLPRVVDGWVPDYEKRPKVVLGFHDGTTRTPRWKRRVMTALRAAMPRVQFLATTHDPLCLRGMRNGEVHVLYRGEDANVALVEDLPDISTLRAEQILTSGYFGLDSTADADQEQILIRLAELAGRHDGELSRDERSERDRLLERFDGLPVIGDSVERQILAEAMTPHLRRQADHRGA